MMIVLIAAASRSWAMCPVSTRWAHPSGARDGYEMVIAENIGDKIPDEQLEQLDPLKLQAILLERRVLYVAERNDLTQHVIIMLDSDFKGAARAPAANAGGK